MKVTIEMLENEIKALQKAAVLHATYSIEQYKKVLFSLEEIEREKKSLEQKVYQRTIHLEKEIAKKEKIKNKLKEDKIIIDNYLKIVDNNVIISVTDSNGVILSASDAFCKLCEFTIDEVLGNRHNIIKSKNTPDSTYKSLWGTINKGKEWRGEIQNCTKNGKKFWVDNTITVQFDKDGSISGYTAIMHDITDKKIIEEISITDGLTNIYNRRHFNHVFPRVINRSKRENSLICFSIMDIDFFKQYNDTYGHQKGDEVLIKVANSIKDSLNRADDYCFRLGGEEFGVIFQTDSREKAIRFTHKIKDNIENLQIEHLQNSASKFITVSMGLICQHAREIKNGDEIYKQADDYLYKAKEEGRNNVYFDS